MKKRTYKTSSHNYTTRPEHIHTHTPCKSRNSTVDEKKNTSYQSSLGHNGKTSSPVIRIGTVPRLPQQSLPTSSMATADMQKSADNTLNGCCGDGTSVTATTESKTRVDAP